MSADHDVRMTAQQNASAKTIEQEVEDFLITASEIVGEIVTFDREGDDIVASIWSDDGKVIEKRRVSVVIGEVIA